ncbi:PIN domain nuclease of toxin-antitoxin system [Breoghania corrubedonensis]|uniref:PIN domain nuclease of toxin-antitoxin system n=1 Tax=Breoghania corrubedonensis TaxID=665038 RepID=A0A2T5VDZ4_9HYPH|nr:type II toxin-antitoxin system VapC family toxin [Breoghania corrubedonensis]PTW61971.1 PIN domain nuclease of toxin-antitoxin system [Breoghania corrubedonensis]
MTPILLDTCAAIWIMDDEPLAEPAVQLLNDAAARGQAVYVSVMTAWEIGLLIARNRYRTGLTAQAWFGRLTETDGAVLAQASAEILINASFLPGGPPNDPMDRIIISTAREHGYSIMTRDRAILDYSEQGHVQAIAC